MAITIQSPDRGEHLLGIYKADRGERLKPGIAWSRPVSLSPLNSTPKGLHFQPFLLLVSTFTSHHPIVNIQRTKLSTSPPPPLLWDEASCLLEQFSHDAGQQIVLWSYTLGWNHLTHRPDPTYPAKLKKTNTSRNKNTNIRYDKHKYKYKNKHNSK